MGTYLAGVNESAISVELSLVEVTLIYNSVREGEFSEALFPPINLRALVA